MRGASSGAAQRRGAQRRCRACDSGCSLGEGAGSVGCQLVVAAPGATVTVGGTTASTFNVTCVAVTAGLEVRTSSCGSHIDPDGYIDANYLMSDGSVTAINEFTFNSEKVAQIQGFRNGGAWILYLPSE